MDKEYHSIDEVSQHLGLKKPTLYALVAAGKIPHYRIGRLIKFKRSDLDQWMEKNKRNPGDASRKAIEISRLIRNPKIDINRLVQQAVDPGNKKRYTPRHGKPDQVKGLGKEVPDGTV
jgi:excisionase family DNA binding protein